MGRGRPFAGVSARRSSRNGARLAAIALVTGETAVACSGSLTHTPGPTARAWPSPADVATIQGVIYSRATDELTSIGPANGTVKVGLRARAADLAREIVDAYGPAGGGVFFDDATLVTVVPRAP